MQAFVSRLKGRPGYEGLPIEVAAVQIAELDTDGDGKLSPSEGSGQGLAIIGHWDAMKDRYWIEDADADEDGKLTSEVRPCAAPRARPAPAELPLRARV